MEQVLIVGPRGIEHGNFKVYRLSVNLIKLNEFLATEL